MFLFFPSARAHHDRGAQAAAPRTRCRAQAGGDVPGLRGGGGLRESAQPPRRALASEDRGGSARGHRADSNSGALLQAPCVSYC